METYKLIRSECTSSQCSRREEIKKQVITTRTNTTEGAYSDTCMFYCTVYSDSPPRGIQSCDQVRSHKYQCIFQMETYKLIKSECTSSQCSRRVEIKKQVITTHTNTTEGAYSVKCYCSYQCYSSFVYHVLCDHSQCFSHVSCFYCMSGHLYALVAFSNYATN